MAGDFGYKKFVEPRQVLLPLIRRCDLPKTAKAKMRDILDVHGCIDDLLQSAALLFARVGGIDDCDELIARGPDKCHGVRARLSPGVLPQSARCNQDHSAENDHYRSPHQRRVSSLGLATLQDAGRRFFPAVRTARGVIYDTSSKRNAGAFG
jgi:hypothetical protein